MEAYCHGGGEGVPSCRVDVPMAGMVRWRSSACRSWAIEESPAGGREPDAASSPSSISNSLFVPLSATVSFAVGSLPSSLLVAVEVVAGRRTWSLVGLRVPPCWGGSWGTLHHTSSAWGLILPLY